MTNGKLLPIFFGLMLIVQTGYSQFITASPVETWKTDNFPSSDYNLNSAYVYLLNGEALRNIFEGEDLTRSERRELDLRRGDYPQYMYLAVSIPDPYNDQNEFTVPLMIHDVRDPNNISRLSGYGGRLLENIPDEVLKKGDIVAKVKFEAFKGNSSESFWKKTAQISIELGKTATSLLAAPLTGNFLALTQQIVPQVTKGLTSLEQADQDAQRITSEFYIRLLDQKLSSLYKEQLVAATLYKIHWDVGGTPRKSVFFRNAEPETVEDLKRLVSHKNSAYILVAHTKAEYNTDHSELVYNQSYIEKKTRDYRKIRNAEKKEIEKEFLETLKLALELKNQIGVFEKSQTTKYPDWLAYSRIIDLYYDIRSLRDEQGQRLASTAPDVQNKYRQLYQNVITDVDLWFNTDLLEQARTISGYLVGASPNYDYSYAAPGVLYHDIRLLDFYRDRVKQMEIQDKLPKEIESLETYTLTNRILFNLESALFNKEFNVPPTLSNEQQKRWLLNKATQQYPKCKICSKRVGDMITRIENLTHEQNIVKYRRISADYYENLGCYEKVYTKLDSFIQSNLDSLTISPFMLEELQKDKAQLDRLADSYSEIVGLDYTVMSRRELSDILSRYYVNQEKLMAVTERLKGYVISRKETECLNTAPRP